MNQQRKQLIALVDNNDNITGYDEKLKVHEEGVLHRAFSIFIFNKKGEILIHRRADHKYHSPGLWTNTCCSHLLQNMTMEECTHDRLQFEMGFDADLAFQFKFTYLQKFGNGLTEHETDHVYFGNWEGTPDPNPDEVADYNWISLNQIVNEIKTSPEDFTYWFKYIMLHFEAKFYQHIK